MKLLPWIMLGTSAVLGVFTLLPWVRSGWWVVRVCDFPRAQFGVACVVGVIVAGALLLLGYRNIPVWCAGALFAICAAVQGGYVIQFLPVWPKAVSTLGQHERGAGLRVLVANLDYENTQHDAVANWLDRDDVDMLVLVEVDENWMEELRGVRERFEHRIEAVRPEGLGIVLWSKLELSETTVEHLVSDDRPSLHGRARLRDGRTVAVHALHPTPPGLEDDDGDRHDSRVRDAELVLLAKRIASEPRTDRIVVGDLNDAAWSHTTRLFLRLSGMLDPRRGRGMYSTYPASTPLLRYPIDHVFVSDGFRVVGLERERAPGSDHLAMFGDFAIVEREGVSPEPEGDDRENGREIVEEGREDAREDDRD